LLATPADSYVAGFVGFDRGIRRLSFFATGGLALDRGPVLDATATVADARAMADMDSAITGGWVLVTADGRPGGWVAAGTLAEFAPGTALARVPAIPFGHAFTVGTDTLRAALDAAVLSPAGLAIGVDGDGRVLGVATFDQIRAAIAASAHAASARDSGDPLGAPA
jgi:osmoprotectant transport system ATP-binding protein